MSDVKVNREGVVSTPDGTIIGHVKKDIRQGLFATAVGASYSGSGTAYYIPYAGDGTCLSEDGYPTRKRAVARIEAHAKPLTVTDVRVETGLGTYAKLVSAMVGYRGYTFGVSRYANETDWTVDFLSTPDSIMPTFSNGTGTRATRAHVLKPEMAEAATRAAIDAGLWPLPDSE